nr:hypothetical protein [Tanacetum cinerariifolium]
MPPKPDLVFHDAPNVNETVHTAFNVKLSPTKPDKDLSHTHRPSAPIIEDWVFDSEDDYEAEPSQNDPSFVQPTEQLKTPRPFVKPVEHPIPAPKTAIPKPKTHGNSRNKKACFICESLTHLIKDCDYYKKKMAQTPARNHAQRGNHQQYARMTHLNPQRHVVPIAVLTRSKLVSLTAVRAVTTAVSPNNAIRPRPTKTVSTKPHSPPRRTIKRRPSPPASNFTPKVTTLKAPKVNVVKGVQGNWGNPQHALKDKGVIDSGCSRHITENMSYLSDSEEINSGYVSFGGNPKGGKISGKGKTMIGIFDGKADEGFLVGYSNTDGDATFEVKEPEFERRKPESEVHVSPSSSAKTKNVTPLFVKKTSPVLNPTRVPYTDMARSSAATLVAGRGKSHMILVIVGRGCHKSSLRGGAAIERARGPGVVLKRRFLEQEHAKVFKTIRHGSNLGTIFINCHGAYLDGTKLIIKIDGPIIFVIMKQRREDLHFDKIIELAPIRIQFNRNLVGYAKRNDFIGVRWWMGWSITSSHGNQLGGDEELVERRRVRRGCDAVGKAGISAFVKCTSMIRQLAYVAISDSLDEYLQIGEKTSRDCLMHFCNGVIELYGEEYLRRPT